MPRGDAVHVEATAWHEAGHALAAMREGRTVIGVEIFPQSPGSGVTVFFPFRRGNRFNPVVGPGNAKASWEDTLERKLAEARIVLAGPLAEAKALNQPLRAIGAEGDLARCRRIIGSLIELRDYIAVDAGVGKVCPVELLNQQRAAVRRWLGRPLIWRAVEAIAEELMAKGRIGAAEVVRAYLETRSDVQRPLSLGWSIVPRGKQRR
jgi:hypothetical protein